MKIRFRAAGAALLLAICLLASRALGHEPPAAAPKPTPTPAPTPPATDIFLLSLESRAGTPVPGPPRRLTDRPGYDNQPAFSPDGRTLYYTAISGGQADIQRYDLGRAQGEPVATTPESEYSPTPMPGGGLSVVRAEADGTQRLWKLAEGRAPELLLPDVKPVGYHAWGDANTLVLFVLGDPPTLQVVDRRQGKAEVVAKDVGRCLRPVPGRAAVAFVRKVSRVEWWIEILELVGRKTTRLVRLPEGVEDYVLLPDGGLLIGQGSRLLFCPKGGHDWREVARFTEPTLQDVTRLAVSPKGDLLALVSTEADFPLTVDSIMRGPELVGYPPTSPRFSGDAKDVYFEWRKPGEDEPSTWVVPASGGEPRRLSDEERLQAPGTTCEWDSKWRLCLFADKGDVVLVDSVARTRRRLTRTGTTESGPHFTPNEKAATFVRDNGLYLATLAGGGDALVQLLEAGLKKAEKKSTDAQKFLEEEERRLLRYVDEAAARKKRDEERKEKEAPAHLDILEGESLTEGRISGDGRYAFALVSKKAEAARLTEVPAYVTVSAYTEMIPSRSNVGDAQEMRRLAVLDLETRKPAWAYVDGVTEPVPEETKKPEGTPEAKEAPKPQDAAKPQRELQWSLPIVSRDGRLAVAAVRAADNKDRWLVLLDPQSGRGRVVDHQHDEAWVREAGPESFGFMPDDRGLWFLSEATGYVHLYVVGLDAENAQPRALTSGVFEVIEARLGPSGSRFYLTTNEADPGERHLYSMPLDGGPRQRLTTTRGAHLAVVSPDESTLAEVYSNARTPPDLYVVPLRDGRGQGRQVTISTRPAFRTFPWIEPRVVRFKARDGVEVPARLYTPEEVGQPRDPRHPGVVFVHGAGYLQNAHRFWSQYYREYMFHHLLASRGYVVLDVDYRGSAGYGRDWRTAIAAHMGGKDLDDVVDGAAYLVAEHGVDAKRLGVYGGSYGGFITLMALFTSPDTFAAGAALRPVTDWAHYNHSYTANILGAPPKDAEAYRKSSPLYFAEGLKGALLICHGMADTNVHFQDSVRLAQRLIELRKENWELAPYPVENHAFEEAASWADEYKRILSLFERELRNKDGLGPSPP